MGLLVYCQNRYFTGMAMNQSEKAAISRKNLREKGASTRDAALALAGGYLSGRQARNSTVAGYPLPLAAGVVGLLMKLRSRAGATNGNRAISSGLIGAGAYGAGKLGEQHGEAAQNDGNLFSWGKDEGFTTD